MSKTLQDKIRWLLVIPVTALILISLIGGVVVYRLMGEVSNEAVRGTQTTIALNRDMDDVQMAFRSQVQEWKDLLLRDRDPQLRQKHYRAFHDRHDEVQASLKRLSGQMAQRGFSTDQASQIRQAHLALLARYEAALTQFPLANKPDNYLKVDELVRGIDRKLIADLELLDYTTEQQVLEQAGSINDKVQGRHLWQLSFVLAIMLALFPLVSLASFGAIGRMTQRIQEERERLHVTLHSIGDAVVMTDPAGAVKYLNPVAEAMTGWPLDEARGRPLPEIFNIVNEDTRKAVANPVEIVLREGHVVGLANHTVLIARNGGECAIEDSAAPVRDMDGKLCGVVLVFQDATKQRRAKRLLQESEERLRMTLRYAPDAVFICEQDGRIVYANDNVLDTLGYSRDELAGMTAFDLVPADWREAYRQKTEQILADNEHHIFEIRLIKKEGSILPMELNAVLLPDGRVYGSCRDITERKQMKQALQQQLAYSRALNQISETLMKSEDTELILKETTRIVGETLGADRSLIYDISFKQQLINGLSEWLNPQCPDISATKGTYPLSVFIGGASAMQSAKTWFSSHEDAVNPNLIADGSGEILHRQMKIKSLLWYPFAFTQDGYYLLVLNQVCAKKEWTQVEIDFLDSVSYIVNVELEKIRLLDERKRAEKALRDSEEHARLLLDSVAEGIYGVDTHGNCTFVNAAFLRILGYRDADEVIGKNIHELIHHSHADGIPYPSEDCRMYQAYRCNEKIHVDDEVFWRRDGSAFEVEYWSYPIIRDGQVVGAVATFLDITQRKQNEEEIYNLAFYDPLTRLPNRRLLMDRLGHTMASGTRSVEYAALMFIDIDNFKTINDTLGHDVGDLLLIETARRLQNCVREGDTVARLGGDEFVVMLEGLSAKAEQAVTQAAMLGEKIRSSLNQPYLLTGSERHSSSSIGIGLFCGREVAVDELLKRADMAMYEAKTSGRNALCFFDPVMQAKIEARSTLETDLRRAVSGQEQFLLHYQAQVDSSGRLIGAEALVRWLHPERGLVSPAEFIPLAEETGLILPLGHWVLSTACQQLAAWMAQPETAHLTLAVNVSAKQFSLPTFVDEVLTLIDFFKIASTKLKLEITESMLLDKMDGAIAKMTALKARGISFSMDDFGTGYSSLSYLKRLPLYQLKIDQSFVRDVLTDPNDASIAKIIVSLAQSMNLMVIAEGVETEAQRAFLELNGCHAFQGYLFSKPVPIGHFEALLLTRHDED